MAAVSKPAAHPLVMTDGVSRRFRVHGRRGMPSHLWAVRDVSLAIARGETLGLVGESGCGKSTLGRLLLRLLDPSEGRIIFDGVDISTMPRRPLRAIRKRMQVIFQDPVGSLNPRMTVEAMLREPIEVHDLAHGVAADDRVGVLLERVGLGPDMRGRYPHELSGGQRQRLGIARALSVEPDFIVADEPVSALDVSIQAQVINLLLDLKDSLRLTYLFISHDLHVVRCISDRIGVMYLGRLVEVGPRLEVYEQPAHPYTLSLLAASPKPGEGLITQLPRGEPPSLLDPPPGCPFHPRCRVAEPRCKTDPPPLREIGPGRQAACHLTGSGLTI